MLRHRSRDQSDKFQKFSEVEKRGVVCCVKFVDASSQHIEALVQASTVNEIIRLPSHCAHLAFL